MLSTFDPHISAIEKLKSTAESLSEETKAHRSTLDALLLLTGKLETLDALVQGHQEQLAGFEDRLQRREDEVNRKVDELQNRNRELFEELEQNDQILRESITNLQDGLKETLRGLVESVIAKSRGELSTYLTEHLSKCVTSHVEYHLDRALQQRQQSSSRKKIVKWVAASPLRITTAPVVPSTPSSVTVPSVAVKSVQPPSLIQSTHRTRINDDLTTAADTSSVMEENETPLGNSISWFSDNPFLDLPEPRGSSSFVADEKLMSRVSCQISGGMTLSGRATPASKHEGGLRHTLDVNRQLYDLGQVTSDLGHATGPDVSDDNFLGSATPKLQKSGGGKDSGGWKLVQCSGTPTGYFSDADKLIV